VSSNLKPNHTSSSTQTTDSLETTWHKIQTSIISAAHVHIPNKKFTVCNFQHIFSSKASQLHSYLKKLGNIIRQIKASIKHQLIIPISHNQTIQELNSSYHLNIPLIPNNYESLSEWISLANTEWKSLYHACNLENIKNIREQINDNITKRCSKLQHNPTSMINSILNRHCDPVRFDNIKTDTDIITETVLIKQHIQEHFNQWTASRHIQTQIFNSSWLDEYQPKANIKSDWYQHALTNFTEDEVSQTLNQLPNNKALVFLVLAMKC